MSSTSQRPSENLSRREALKAVGALGTAIAASSLLPARWSKPQIGVGVLPAHAQGSQPLELLNCSVAPYVGTVISPNNPIMYDGKVALEATLSPPTQGVELQANIRVVSAANAVLDTDSKTATTDSTGSVIVNYHIRGVDTPGCRLLAEWFIAHRLTPLCSSDEAIEYSPIG